MFDLTLYFYYNNFYKCFIIVDLMEIPFIYFKNPSEIVESINCAFGPSEEEKLVLGNVRDKPVGFWEKVGSVICGDPAEPVYRRNASILRGDGSGFLGSDRYRVVGGMEFCSFREFGQYDRYFETLRFWSNEKLHFRDTEVSPFEFHFSANSLNGVVGGVVHGNSRDTQRFSSKDFLVGDDF